MVDVINITDAIVKDYEATNNRNLNSLNLSNQVNSITTQDIINSTLLELNNTNTIKPNYLIVNNVIIY